MDIWRSSGETGVPGAFSCAGALRVPVHRRIRGSAGDMAEYVYHGSRRAPGSHAAVRAKRICAAYGFGPWRLDLCADGGLDREFHRYAAEPSRSCGECVGNGGYRDHSLYGMQGSSICEEGRDKAAQKRERQ